MKLCIADPPYLGRAHRWYGVGGLGDSTGVVCADEHPEAAEWDKPERHQQLVAELERDFDGWAIAMSVHSLSTYLSCVDTDSRNGIRVAVWYRRNSINSPSVRVLNRWEPVLLRIPEGRKGRASVDDPWVDDVLPAPKPSKYGFMGAKPPAWTRWVLDMLGHQPDDEVVDMFPGSGAVTNELAQGVLL
jgi:hypothetical protein